MSEREEGSELHKKMLIRSFPLLCSAGDTKKVDPLASEGPAQET